jgi:hypothetical protein
MGFIIGSVVGLATLLFDSSILTGLCSAEVFCLVLGIILLWGGFGSLLELILKIILRK